MTLKTPVIIEGKFKDGIIGGKTFDDGTKSLIYQCGECGQLTEQNTAYNDHRETKHGLVRQSFGFADPQEWKEIDALENKIVRMAK